MLQETPLCFVDASLGSSFVILVIFVAQNDTSVDVELCGFLDRRWFLFVLVNKAQPGLAVCWGESWERNLCWLER